MFFQPVRLGPTALPAETVTADKNACRHFGPCGVGKEALYLNSYFLDRRYYVALADVRRVFKRVAMSKGGFTGSGGGILMLTVFTLVLGYNLKVAVGTSTMIMSLVALTGAVSHVSLGAQLFPLPMAIVVASCLLGAVVSAKFANRCEIRRLNRIVGIVLILLGAVTILIKLL